MTYFRTEWIDMQFFKIIIAHLLYEKKQEALRATIRNSTTIEKRLYGESEISRKYGSFTLFGIKIEMVFK